MVGLGKDSMEAWFGLLPEDVASCMERPGEEGQAEAEKVEAALRSITNSSALVEFISGNEDAFISMGRARRIRFLAWLAAGDYPDKVKAIMHLSDTESTGDGAGGAGKIAPYFKEDIRALVEALGPRKSRAIVDAATLAVITGAGLDVAGELEMRSGGGSR